MLPHHSNGIQDAHLQLKGIYLVLQGNLLIF